MSKALQMGRELYASSVAYIDVLTILNLQLSLCLIDAMKTYVELGDIALALGRGEWSASCPDSFTPGGSAPSASCIGRWVAQGLVSMLWRRKYLLPIRNQTPVPWLFNPA
jgi:hypothetical protein